MWTSSSFLSALKRCLTFSPNIDGHISTMYQVLSLLQVLALLQSEYQCVWTACFPKSLRGKTLEESSVWKCGEEKMREESRKGNVTQVTEDWTTGKTQLGGVGFLRDFFLFMDPIIPRFSERRVFPWKSQGNNLLNFQGSCVSLSLKKHFNGRVCRRFIPIKEIPF